MTCNYTDMLADRQTDTVITVLRSPIRGGVKIQACIQTAVFSPTVYDRRE